MKNLKKILGLLLAFVMVFGIVDVAPFTATKAGAEISASYATPSVTPPAGEHPRVMFRSSDIPDIEAGLLAEENANAVAEYENFSAQVLRHGVCDPTNESDKGANGSYDGRLLAKIEATAFNYAMTGTEENGLKAIAALLKYFDTCGIDDIANFGSSVDDQTRYAGFNIYVASEVYDWCYSLLTPDQKSAIIANCEKIAGYLEMGYPPTTMNALTGHGAEAQLLRSLLAFAIATYDERPDIWNVVGGRFYEEYVPARQFYVGAHFPLEGDSYGLYRHQWDTWAYLLITGMGAEEPYSGVDLAQVPYGMIYMRRPDGQWLRDGDTYADTSMWKYWGENTMSFVLDAAIGNDPYLKEEVYKRNKSMSYSYEASPVISLIVNRGSRAVTEHYSLSNLPLSKYFGAPVGMSIARTGWKDGSMSPAVVAEMKVGGLNLMNHQHMDAGHFQIYYKGILASDSGVYQGANNDREVGGTAYGSDHYNLYQTKAVAHNTMLVLDPNEYTVGLFEDKSTNRIHTRDGGQTVPNGGITPKSITDALKDNVIATVEAQEIDPKNANAPDYTYIKGNLTNAYSDKVSDYKRSFMFFNMKDDEVPGVMVVFDKITSSKASFQKQWLLHGLEEPTISGNQTIFRRTYGESQTMNRYNGKLTVDTLLPASVSITKRGGSNVDGSDSVIYDAGDWTKVPGIKYDNNGDEGSTWRIEVSPTASNKTDYFLNVLQVSDNDKEYYIAPTMIDESNIYGAQISDRVVTFSKSGEKISDAVSFTTTGTDTLKYTLTDMEMGTWSVVIGEDAAQNYVVSEEGGVLSFEGAAGTVTATYVDATGTPLEYNPTFGTEKEYYTRFNNIFAYNNVDPYYDDVNAEFIMPLSTIAKYYALNVERNDNTVTVSNNDRSVTLTIGSADMVSSIDAIGIITTNVAVYEDNGEIMIPADEFVKMFGGNMIYKDAQRTAFIDFPKTQAANGIALAYSVDGETFTDIENFDYSIPYYEVALPNDTNIAILRLTDTTNGTVVYRAANTYAQAQSDIAPPVFATNTVRQFKLLRKSTDGKITIKYGDGTGYAEYTDPNGYKWDYEVYFTSKQYKIKEFISYLPSGQNIAFVSGGAVANDNGTLMDTASSSGKKNTWALGNISEYLVGQSMFMLPISEMGKSGSYVVSGSVNDKLFSFSSDRSFDVTVLMANPAAEGSDYLTNWTTANNGTSANGITTGSSNRSPSGKNSYTNTDYFACAYNWISDAEATNPVNRYRTDVPGPDTAPKNGTHVSEAATKLAYAYTKHVAPGETVTIYNPGNITNEKTANMPVFLKWGDEYTPFTIKYSLDGGATYNAIPNFDENVTSYDVALPQGTLLAKLMVDGNGESSVEVQRIIRTGSDYNPNVGSALIGDFHSQPSTTAFQNLYVMRGPANNNVVPIANEETNAFVKFTPADGRDAMTYTIRFHCQQPRLTELDLSDGNMGYSISNLSTVFIGGAAAYNDNRTYIDSSEPNRTSSNATNYSGRTQTLGNISKELEGASMFVLPYTQMVSDTSNCTGGRPRELFNFKADTPGKVVVLGSVKVTTASSPYVTHSDGWVDGPTQGASPNTNMSTTVSKGITYPRNKNDYTNMAYNAYAYRFKSNPNRPASYNDYLFSFPGITGVPLNSDHVDNLSKLNYAYIREFEAGETVTVYNLATWSTKPNDDDKKKEPQAVFVVWDMTESINVNSVAVVPDVDATYVITDTSSSYLTGSYDMYAVIYEGNKMVGIQKVDYTDGENVFEFAGYEMTGNETVKIIIVEPETIKPILAPCSAYAISDILAE